MLDEAQVGKACSALAKHLELRSQGKSKKSLFGGEDAVVSLIITLKRIPANPPKKPITIRLPHALFTEGESEVVLVTKDPQRHFKDLVEQEGVTAVSRVIGFTKLKTKHTSTHEDRRRLCAAYDVFLADTRVVPLLPRVLGREFTRRRKRPVPVDLTRGSLRNAISAAMSSTQVYLNGGGATVAVRFGRVGMEVSELVANAVAVMSGVTDRVGGGWSGVQAVSVKTNDSLALPVFRSAPGNDPTAVESFTKSQVRRARAKGKVLHANNANIKANKDKDNKNNKNKDKDNKNKGTNNKNKDSKDGKSAAEKKGGGNRKGAKTDGNGGKGKRAREESEGGGGDDAKAAKRAKGNTGKDGKAELVKTPAKKEAKTPKKAPAAEKTPKKAVAAEKTPKRKATEEKVEKTPKKAVVAEKTPGKKNSGGSSKSKGDEDNGQGEEEDEKKGKAKAVAKKTPAKSAVKKTPAKSAVKKTPAKLETPKGVSPAVTRRSAARSAKK